MHTHKTTCNFTFRRGEKKRSRKKMKKKRREERRRRGERKEERAFFIVLVYCSSAQNEPMASILEPTQRMPTCPHGFILNAAQCRNSIQAVYWLTQ